MGTMPWLAIDYANEAARQSFASTHGVSGIPALHKADTTTGEIEKDWRNKCEEINAVK